MLHAFGIYFTHPTTKKQMSFVAPIWSDFMEILITNFDKEIVDEKIDLKKLNSIFSTCDEWLLLA